VLMLAWPAFAMTAIGDEPTSASVVIAVCLRSWNGRGCLSTPAVFSADSNAFYVKTLTLTTTAVGPLSAAFGVPDGTPGQGTLNVNINKNSFKEQTSLSVLNQ